MSFDNNQVNQVLQNRQSSQKLLSRIKRKAYCALCYTKKIMAQLLGLSYIVKRNFISLFFAAIDAQQLQIQGGGPGFFGVLGFFAKLAKLGVVRKSRRGLHFYVTPYPLPPVCIYVRSLTMVSAHHCGVILLLRYFKI